MSTNTPLLKTIAAKTCLLVSTLLVIPSVGAETTNCTSITSIPAVISTPGSYCLGGNFNLAMDTGKAIDIQSKDVVLDMNGHYLDNSLAPKGVGQETYGIYSSSGDNVTVRNGMIRGFYWGISMAGAGGSTYGTVVEDMRVQDACYRGIVTTDQNSVIRRNIVHSTGGTSLEGKDTIVGIFVSGKGSSVEDNLVYNTYGLENDVAYGIEIDSTQGLVEARNNVIAKTLNTIVNPTFSPYGIKTTAANAMVKNNFVLDAENTLDHAEKYMNNLSETAIYGSGTPVGHND